MNHPFLSQYTNYEFVVQVTTKYDHLDNQEIIELDNYHTDTIVLVINTTNNQLII